LLLLSLVRYSYFFGIIRFCIVPSLSFTVLYTPAIAVYIIITHQYIYQLFSLLCAEILLLFVSILFFEIFYSFLDYARTVFAPVLTAYSLCFNFVLVRTRTIILVYLKINYLEAEAIYSKTTHNIPFFLHFFLYCWLIKHSNQYQLSTRKKLSSYFQPVLGKCQLLPRNSQ
jgi:hypothetical protein